MATPTLEQTTQSVGNLPNLATGGFVDLGAAGKYIKNADGTFTVAPTTTDPNNPPQTPSGTQPTSAVLSSSGARDAIGKASTYIAQNTPPPTNPGAAIKYDPNNPYNLGPDGKPLAGTGNFTDSSMPNGGKPADTTTPDTGTPAITSSGNPEFDSFKASIDASNKQLEQDAADFQSKSDSIVARLDSANATLIQSITANYASLIDSQKKVNDAYLGGVTQSGIRGGQQRYAPEDYTAQITREMNNGIDRIAKLEGERDKLIADAQTASANSDWDVYYKTYETLQANRAQQSKNVQDLYDKSQTLKDQAAKDAQAQLDNLTKTQALQKNTIDSLASYADAHLSEFEGKNDQQGAADFIQKLADQYGIDSTQLLSSVEALRQKNKGWGDTYTDQRTGQTLQRNLQTGEVRSIYTPSTSNGGVTGGAGTAGVSQALLDSIDAGRIDPNKINSRTVALYNQIAEAQVNAVSSHADSAAKTKAYSDTYAIRTNAARLIDTLDKNMPLIIGLADKVNTAGVPGIDDYINSVKTYTGNDETLGKYINTLTTLRNEYANMLAKGAQVTESMRSEANSAIPSGKNSAFYAALQQQLDTEGKNIISASDEALKSLFPDKGTDSNSSSTTSDINSLRSKYNY
jgi:CHASE3 domain sensor protein